MTETCVGGIPTDIACMTATACVAAGYNSHSVGDVIALRHGAPTHVSVIAGTQAVYSVSCPSSAGCIGLVRTGNDIGTELAVINAAGVVTRVLRYSTPAGTNLGHLSCVALTRCVLAGGNLFSTPPSIEVAWWNGASLSFHRVGVPGKPTSTIVTDVACIATTCDVVGYLSRLSSYTGISLQVTGTTGFHLHTVGHDLLYADACASAVRCYAVGYTATSGVLVTLVNGSATTTKTSLTDLSDISCAGSLCSTVAQTPAVPASPGKYWGVVYTVVNGSFAATTDVPQATSLGQVAQVGASWAAVGSAPGTFVVATTG